MTHSNDEEVENPPAFNIPAVVLAVILSFVATHVVRTYLISETADYWLLLTFSFIPIAYDVALEEFAQISLYWRPITYGFLHGDWTHLAVNSVWLTAFGSAVARRFGNTRFLLFMGLATAAGALAHYIFHPNGVAPVIGASGAVSACMGASIRFALSPGMGRTGAIHTPALSLINSLKNRNIMTFVIIWFALNWLFGSGALQVTAGDAQIAWEAHMGGFLFGWLGFALFDRKAVIPEPHL